MPAVTTPALFRLLAPHRRRLAVAVCFGLATAAASHAQITILHPFAGGPSDGANSYASLTLSGSYLYGTTDHGGVDNAGVAFRIATDGSGYTILHQFNGTTDGSSPGALTISGSMIYGSADSAGPSSLGTAFSMDTDGSGFTVIHDFTGGPADGGVPDGALTISGSTLYGATAAGGLSGHGTVFTMSTTGTGYSILHSFSTDGEPPEGPLILSGSKLYGTAYSAVSSGGAVFSMNLDGSSFTFLHTFLGNGGAQPSSLTLVGSKLYGVTTAGGSGSSGTIFSINTDGTGYDVLYNFAPSSLVQLFPGSLTYAGGKLYGTSDGSGAAGKGLIYSINLDGTGFDLIHSFTGGSDGAFDGIPLTVSSNGATLYGTTIAGGVAGNGVIFSFPSAAGPIIQNRAPVGTSLAADFTVIGSVTTGGSTDSNTINSLFFKPGGTLTIHNTLTLTSGNVATSGGTNSINGGTLSGPSGLNFDVTGNLTVASALAGSGVTKSGSGVLTITSSNTYSGGTQVTAGVLAVGNNHALGTDAVTLSTGAELRGVGTVTLPNTVNFAGAMTAATVSATTGSTFTLTGLDATNLSALTIGSAGNTGTVSVAPSAVTNNSGVATIEVAFGTLRNGGGLSGLTGPAASTTVDKGATLAVNDLNLTVTALQGNGAVTLGTKTATTLTLQGATNFAGVISGTGQVTIGGDATFTGANTYTGGTTIGALSSLDVGGQTTTGSLAGNVTLTDPTSFLKFDRTNASSFAGAISGAGVVEQTGGGVVTLSGNSTYSGGTEIQTGVVAITNANALGTGPVTLGGIATELRGIGIVTLANTINFANVPGTYGGTFSTSGTLILASVDATNAQALVFGSPGYTGAVVLNSVTNGQLFDTVEVRAGTLRNGGGLGGLPGVFITVDPGATLAVNDLGFAVNSLLGTGSVTLGTKTATTLTLQGSSGFAGVISGAGQVEISGDEVFDGANTYTGGTTIDSSASLVVGGDTSGPGLTGSIVGNVAIGLAGQLNFNRSNSYTFGGAISGAGFVEQSGGGVLTLSGSSTYSGGTEVSSGVLAMTNGHALGTGAVTLDDGAELRGIGTFILGNTVEFGGFSSPAVATISTTGTLTLVSLDGMNSDAAKLIFGSTGNAGAVVVNSASNLPASFDVEIHNGTLRNGGGLSGLTGLANSTTVDSGATLALNDLNLTVNALQGNGSVTLGTNTATTLALQGSSVFAGVISGAGQVNISGDMTFTGANTYTGGTTIAPLSSLDLGNGIFCSGTSGSLVGNVTVGSDGALIFDRNNNYTFGGVISGAGSVLQVGAGVLTLTGHNTYSGGTLVDFGVLAFSNANALGTGTIRVQDDGELRATGTTVVNSTVRLARFDEDIISATAGSTLTINKLNAREDTVIFGSPGNTGTVLIGPGARTSSTTGLVVEYGTLGNAGGLGALTANSPGMLVFPGAKLALNDFSITLSNIATGPGSSVSLGTKATTVLTLTSLADIEGVISGAGSVIVAGQAYFLGANTYTGGTTVAANSSLDLGGQFTAGSVMGNIALSDSTAALFFDRTNAYNFNGVISGPGSVQQIGGGVLTLANSNTYSGGTEIGLGVLAISNANALGTGPVTLDDGTELRGVFPPAGSPIPTPAGGPPMSVTLNNTVQFASGTNNATLSAATNRIFILNSLDMSNTAAVTFGSAANTGTVVIGPGVTLGPSLLSITVADGTLQNGGGLGTLTDDTTVTVNAGAKVALNDISTTVLKLVGSGSVSLGTKAATVLTLDHATYAGVISGAGHVNASGAGVNFQTANTYTGGTTVSQGSLIATNTSGSATGSGPVAINNGGTIGGSGTVSGAMSLNTGGLIEPGVNSPAVAGTKFHGSSLLWNAGGALSFQIGSTADELLLSGALTKGTAGTFEIDVLDASITPGTYTLVTFASTTFGISDFTLELPSTFPAADGALLTETNTSLVLTITHSQLPAHFAAFAEPALAGTGTTESDLATSFVATPAPEPTTATLLTVGLGAFLARRRRRG